MFPQPLQKITRWPNEGLSAIAAVTNVVIVTNDADFLAGMLVVLLSALRSKPSSIREKRQGLVWLVTLADTLVTASNTLVTASDILLGCRNLHVVLEQWFL